MFLLNTLPVPTCLAQEKLLLECSAYSDALFLLEGMVATDDSIVKRVVLDGMDMLARGRVQESRRHGRYRGVSDNSKYLEWQDMERDWRDCLQMC